MQERHEKLTVVSILVLTLLNFVLPDPLAVLLNNCKLVLLPF